MKKQTLKRWLASLLSTAMLFSMVTIFGNVPQAAAASTYNGQQAATWGWNNYKNNYGLCAEFVSNCLKQGGFTDAFSNSCGTLRRQLLNSGAFQENVVYLNSNKRLYTSGSNSGKIAVGDVIMWHKSGTSTYPHTALVYSISKGYVQTVQRNPAGSYSYLNYTPYDNNGTKYEVICYHYVGGDSCSTAYAGWYKVKSGGVNVNSGHNFNSYVGELAGGTHIYVNKASGLGRSQIGHITYNGKECYVAMNLLEECDHDPKGSVDSWGGDIGAVYVNGWAFDYDNTGVQLAVNIYLDGVWSGAGYANTNRSDIENSYPDVGAYHGFSIRIGTQLTGSHKLEVWASNVGSGNDVCLRSTTVNIPAETEPPVISNVKVENLTSEGYDVSCTVTDNVGVNRVVFPTWTALNGQDDLAQEWWAVDHKATLGTRNGDTWTFHVNIADHNNEHGAYLTHIYAYDGAGNRVCYEINDITVPYPEATVTFDANGGSAEFVSKTVPYGDAYGVLPEASCTGYIFDGWYTEPTGGQKVTKDTACNTYGEVRLYAQWKPTSAGGWSFSNGVLTIDCRGAMENFDSAVEAPWFSVRSQVERIVVTEGVTSLSDYAFFGCENAESITLPTSLERIGKLSLYGCKSLSNLTIPSAVAEIGDYAFARASGLKQVVFEGTAPQIGAGAFAEVPAEIIYPANDPSWTESVQQSYTGRLTWTVYDAAALDLETELAVAE